MYQEQNRAQPVRSYPNTSGFEELKGQHFPVTENEIAKIDLIDDNVVPTTPFISKSSFVVPEILPVPKIVPLAQHKPQSAWGKFLHSPKVSVAIGLLVGIGLLFLVAHFVNIPATIHVLQKNLITPRGIALAVLSGIAFLLAYTVRGIRWKIFLYSVGEVSTFRTVRLFLIGVFINFLLPVQGGEVVKSAMLKRITGIPMYQSLPTVAMDKSLDLMPALFIMAIVPFLGIHMDIRLWLVLGVVSALFIGVIIFVVLAFWKRTFAITLLRRMIGKLPAIIADKAENFAIGFVDSLITGVRRPKIFACAILLTCVAVVLDSLFSMLAFWAIGVPISFGTAIFGYTVFNLFYILPNPPGQVGSNEGVGLLIYSGLLHIPADRVLALMLFAHPFTALLLCITGLTCLSSFGFTISRVMKVEMDDNVELLLEEEEQKAVL